MVSKIHEKLIMKNSLFFILISFLLLHGCDSSKLKPHEYIKWFQENDKPVVASFEDSNVVYELVYFPAEYILLLQQPNPSKIDIEKFNADLNEISKIDYYCLRMYGKKKHFDLLKQDNPKKETVDLRNDILSYRINSAVRLFNCDDTLNCIMHHYENSAGIKPYHSVLFAFENISCYNDSVAPIFIYKDILFTSNDIKYINVSKEIINQMPKLSI